MTRTLILLSVVSLRGYRVPSCRCRHLRPSIYSFSLTDFRSRLAADLAFPRGTVGSVNGGNDTGAWYALFPPSGPDKLTKAIR
jgi:hypothetical protein